MADAAAGSRGVHGASVSRRRAPGKHAQEGHELGVLGGLAALSLDALSSVAYGPEAMVLVLIAAGTGALRFTVPLTLVITAMLVLLVVSYTQVIAAHPEGGGAYAVAKRNLGRWPSLLAAAAVVVDYVLTVAVSLAAGAASLGSVFPSFSHHLLLVSLAGLTMLTVVNMFGIAESAKLLMLPAAVFVVSILAMIVVGVLRPHAAAHVGSYLGPIKPTTALGVVLLLKAFAAGSSAVTGVEAISNGVPAFREPRVRTAQRTEISLGVLLGLMLVGLALLIRAHHVVPRGGVTILAQVSASAFGTGWPFYVSNVAVAVVLALAANTSFGGLPVLMSLLARDNRLPHLFYLRAERPVYRHGIVALALAAGLLLVAVRAQTSRLIPLFTIGVFIGFTISQIGLVRHWFKERPPHWRVRAALNGTGGLMTAVAVVVFLSTKFLAGAWVVTLVIPLLIFLFARTESYYAGVARELRLGTTPPPPRKRDSVVVIPAMNVSLLTERAVSAALSLGNTVVAVAVAGDEQECEEIKRDWDTWKSGVPIEVLIDPRRSLVRTVLHYIDSLDQQNLTITVLIPEIIPRKRRHEIFHDQRGRLLEAALKQNTEVVIATLPFHTHD
ncbi:MAG TPA: APC family permease [Solirubrobacteraceae bacterium]|jgi:amino acid transporter|nr:APC family permease [Solirubrobacteraceae bacterium]